MRKVSEIVKRMTLLLSTIAVLLTLSGVPALAQHGGGHGPGGPAGGPGGGVGRGPEGTRGGPNSDRGGIGQGNNPSVQGAKTPGELLSHNTKLASRLQALLPPGTDLQAAASGFKNLGQFVAAVHVAHNLGIPFDQLKAKIAGGDSLGKAIHNLKPEANPKTEAKRAHKQANDDINESES